MAVKVWVHEMGIPHYHAYTVTFADKDYDRSQFLPTFLRSLAELAAETEEREASGIN